MSIRFFLLLSFFGTLLASCGGNNSIWYDGYTDNATSTPSYVQSEFLQRSSVYGEPGSGPRANIAVLLPTTGSAASIGKNIRTSIETAVLQKPASNIKVSFYDISGETSSKLSVMREAIDSNPDIIIGPLFAEDTKLINDMKPEELPVLSFTSDILSVGHGVMSMALMPTQSIEAIIKQMKQDGTNNLIIISPKDKSGKLMTAVADSAADLYDIPVKGIFYYTPNNSDSIKELALQASMYTTRTAANTKAREILSDILTKETLTDKERSNLNTQLEKISKTETLGGVPYDAILFLGNGNDSKTIASFLRYYSVGARDAAFYGTTLWQGSDITSDFTMSGSKFATLPDISEEFKILFEKVSGQQPDYLSAFGYDAANMALGMVYSTKSHAAYLIDPSGYIGVNGIFRLQPSGESERGLRIVELDASGAPKNVKAAPINFLTPLYNIHANNLDYVSEKELETMGINPKDFIKIPERFNKKYKAKTIGAKISEPDIEIKDNTPVQVYESTETVIENPDFQPVKLETVSRKYIDSVEVSE